MTLRSLTYAAALLCFAAPAQAFFKVCNNSNETVYVAIGYEGNDGFYAEGWWEISRGNCANVLNGNLQLRYYYLRAEGARGTLWDGNYFFCTTEAAFTLRDSPNCVSATVDREGFFEVDTGQSVQWTQTLTP
jgi:uncharacterized membrane protein